MARRPHPSSPLALATWAVAILCGGLALQSTLIAGPARAAVNDTPGSKGAQIYCFMRGAGNTHEVSWTAAYALLKRQSASLFKTSPEHGAVMITEAVVQNPGNFPDCGKFLGSLYEKSAITATTEASGSSNSSAPGIAEGTTSINGAPRSNRYSY